MTARLPPTPSQTIGPFFEFGLLRPSLPELVPAGTQQDEAQRAPLRGAIRVEGVVRDGQNLPVSDALLEIWQASPYGRFAHPKDTLQARAPVRDELDREGDFTGFGRLGTDASGKFRFLTLKPGSVPWTDGRSQAPHLNISIFARGLVHRLVTRMYFPDEEEANAADPLLCSIEDSAVRDTLIARREADTLRFDICLQGDGETCFLQI